MTEQTQAVYGSSDVADVLQIQESTLRKYCLLLEKAGYEFLKNEHGHRAFFDNDVIVLRKMIGFKSDADMTLEEAVKSVVAWKNGNDITVRDTEDMRYVARYNDLVREFEAFQEQQRKFNEQQIKFNEQQMKFNEELIREIRGQREYIENRLEQRDQLLMQSIRESLEVRKEIATAEKEKKWWQFWK